ncbi:MAG: prepilin-type N-terminal cleavage/methylation domain-containing protein [Actinomycetota bacterium]|nr:prepilin-type N-terminal cleavage/methylation domain-containing protein [Actinomycetota bacterium]
MHQAINKLRDRRRDGEEGFTLIELMVVVLIIAILLAIAIPTFLGARARAQDRAAQSSLRNSLTAAKTVFTDNQNYTEATFTTLNGIEPSIKHVAAATPSTGAKEVSVNPVSASEWVAASKSASGKCFSIKETSGGPTAFASNAATCDGTAAASATYTDKW